MNEHRHPLVDRLRARRVRHAKRGTLYRVAFAGASFLVLGAGLAMLVLPGPGLLVAAAGLGMLALEFAWAERTLVRTTARLAQARGASRGRQALGAGVVILGVAALVVAGVLWNPPLLPV